MDGTFCRFPFLTLLTLGCLVTSDIPIELIIRSGTAAKAQGIVRDRISIRFHHENDVGAGSRLKDNHVGSYAAFYYSAPPVLCVISGQPHA